ncbi:hypothetical protein [Oribacterium sp. WCC10]|uniref:hypothetical protein n=1 Tax=Oribacterium sp. WCC10 TaxID=1855343 RepID=UPI0008E81D4F|nr:hypothetical protein [Oribacterium sp. WCC10]SFG65472.1 hypothetical protein SAMN05216356_11741 [Oribacterium sp. WCC10]
MKKKLMAAALVLGLSLSTVSVSMAAISAKNVRQVEGNTSTGGGSSSGGTGSSTGSSGVTSGSSVGSSVDNGSYTNSKGDTITKNTATDGANKLVTEKNERTGYVFTTGEKSNTDGSKEVVRSSTVPNGTVVDSKPIAGGVYFYVRTETNGTKAGGVIGADGNLIATGKTEFYNELTADGTVLTHYVDAFGRYLVGQQVINGVTYLFNEEGIIIG